MALHKRTASTPKMPFPGESPTVSLALAAGQQYGLHEEAETPKKTGKTKAKKKPVAKKAKVRSK